MLSRFVAALRHAGRWTISPSNSRQEFRSRVFVDHFVKDMGIALEEARRRQLTLPGSPSRISSISECRRSAMAAPAPTHSCWPWKIYHATLCPHLLPHAQPQERHERSRMAPHSDAHRVMSLSACSGPRGLNRQILQESFHDHPDVVTDRDIAATMATQASLPSPYRLAVYFKQEDFPAVPHCSAWTGPAPTLSVYGRLPRRCRKKACFSGTSYRQLHRAG